LRREEGTMQPSEPPLLGLWVKGTAFSYKGPEDSLKIKRGSGMRNVLASVRRMSRSSSGVPTANVENGVLRIVFLFHYSPRSGKSSEIEILLTLYLICGVRLLDSKTVDYHPE
jgi:hypothetical protein